MPTCCFFKNSVKIKTCVLGIYFIIIVDMKIEHYVQCKPTGFDKTNNS